ncbi:MAG: 50S ribosomal protein L6 [Candidatus Paceibacterota bacterium]|jgi:large subunit ribosomal protein L6|nr:50S ribosomal protein L6 [Candidatus Paceibacterota bacterium]MDD3548523.1 50S ribosomal protein L6 [Candidatus Paceibacterota bacterium]MDD4999066.1 50S ribosomal protein L6 [Candidatus Paceibacterota bacterium]MDD5545233.1 50S ribosomal protein L6 [Candidatus Paceibacterota bacterium]
MSRLGKKAIIIPPSIELHLEDDFIKVKGPKGEESFELPDNFKVEFKDGLLSVVPIKKTKNISVLWGTVRALINNIIQGVDKGFERKLEIKGVGYRADVEAKNLVLKLGYSHPVIIPIPEGIEVKVEKNIISVYGINKEKVGQFAAIIKSKKPVEPYKGRGIHYVGEEIRRKEGKKVAGATAG